jgi:hypothetical protein
VETEHRTGCQLSLVVASDGSLGKRGLPYSRVPARMMARVFQGGIDVNEDWAALF